ncbi:MAG TPA: M23 family metallopeptidase [Patescibacteria group bacterium]|jgi:hypothetical protein|nr:M23 family metallopeptidase [Patescibacteria group bacterium]
MQKLAQMILMLGVFGVLWCAQALTAKAFSLDPTGMAKPVADLRDYNGTYEGSIGTGSIGYSTLYRDNEDGGGVSGCRGEGCGKHPGVDIPVPTGTKVFSTTYGMIVISRCDDSWGGLVVIKGQSPWTGETLYFIYAHLSAREYSNSSPVLEGQYVTTGVNIGKSGGASKSPCHGNSTGAHLHFQIDRDDGSPEPYYPSMRTLNNRDDNYSVSTQTYNPVVFVMGGYRWTFNSTGTSAVSRELWDLFNFQSWGVGNGSLYVDGSLDPYIRRGGGLVNCGQSKPCSNNLNIDAGTFRQVYLDLYNNCSTGVGKVYFTTNLSPNWGEDKTVPYFTNYGAISRHIWMLSNPKWNGIITGLRIDPADNCSPVTYDPTYYGEITIER